MDLNNAKRKLKRTTWIITVFLGIYFISILLFLTISRNEIDISDLESIWEPFLITLIGSVGLPIVGVLLILYGAHLTIRGGFEGLLPAEPIGLALSLFVGPALALAFPIFVFVDNNLSALTVIHGILLLTIVLPIAFMTLLFHGGSDLVQKDKFGRSLASIREKLHGRIFNIE